MDRNHIQHTRQKCSRNSTEENQLRTYIINLIISSCAKKQAVKPSYFLHNRKNFFRFLCPHLPVFNHAFSKMKEKGELTSIYLSLFTQKATHSHDCDSPHNRTSYLMLPPPSASCLPLTDQVLKCDVT